MTYIGISNNYIAHHGIKGMKWGIRRYQNKDGSLTPAGHKRYGQNGEASGTENGQTRTRPRISKKTAIGIGVGVGAAAAITAGVIYGKKNPEKVKAALEKMTKTASDVAKNTSKSAVKYVEKTAKTAGATAIASVKDAIKVGNNEMAKAVATSIAGVVALKASDVISNRNKSGSDTANAVEKMMHDTEGKMHDAFVASVAMRYGDSDAIIGTSAPPAQKQSEASSKQQKPTAIKSSAISAKSASSGEYKMVGDDGRFKPNLNNRPAGSTAEPVDKTGGRGNPGQGGGIEEYVKWLKENGG